MIHMLNAMEQTLFPSMSSHNISKPESFKAQSSPSLLMKFLVSCAARNAERASPTQTTGGSKNGLKLSALTSQSQVNNKKRARIKIILELDKTSRGRD